MACQGNLAEHCCYIDGEPCTHLRDDGQNAERRWVCTLREELGSWAAVHVDERYQAEPAPVWRRIGIADCGDWPASGDACSLCGEVG